MRWPFAVALVAVLVGVGAMFATPHIKTRWQAWQDAREERQWAAAFKREQPAADAVARMPLPDGVQNCPGLVEDSVAKTHMVCWRGAADVEPATISLAKNLRAAGAQNVAPRCVHKDGARSHIHLTRCEVSAEIQGHPFFAHLAPQIDKIGDSYDLHGVAVAGGVGSQADEDLLSILGAYATPLPLP